jgi:hypothetical protein
MIMIRLIHLAMVIICAHLLVLSVEQHSYGMMALSIIFGAMLTSMWTPKKS